jgi:hypothetical protein
MNQATISKGQKVYSGLCGGRNGIIFNIHGQQSPSSIRSISGGGCIVMGGIAEFDIVFESGTISRMIPESIVRGVQWEIYDEIASQDEIDAALMFAQAEDIRKTEEERLGAIEREKSRISFREQHPELETTGGKKSGGVLCAANIRKELKKAFPGIKFYIHSDYSSVNIHWTDGPTAKELKAITDKYENGSFDGMTDCYNYASDAWNDVFGGVNYVFEERGYSEAFLRARLIEVEAKYGKFPDDVSAEIIVSKIDYTGKPYAYVNNNSTCDKDISGNGEFSPYWSYRMVLSKHCQIVSATVTGETKTTEEL